MAIYKINNDVYDIPEEVVSDFERDNPDAVISYRVGKDEYEIPLHEKGGFLKHFPDAVSLIEEPVDTSMDFVTPKPRVDVTGPVPAQPEYKNPLTNTPEYNLESIRQSGAIEMVKGERDDKGRLRDAVAEKRASVVPELGQAIEDVEESKRKYRKEHPVLSALSGFRGSMAPSVEGIHINDPKFRNLSAASQLLNESEKLLARRNGGSGVIEGTKSVIEGAKEAASDLNTYSMGLTEMLDNSNVLSAITKFEKGEELSSDEQHLLDAVAINMSAQAVAGDPDLGHLAGSAFVESIPFMVEMMMNPISGAGEGLGKAMTKYALKRFGKEAGSKALEKGAKIAGRVAGDAMAATGMSATSGIVGVAADATARMTGAPVYTDDFGEVSFGDVARDEKGEMILDGNGKPVPVGSVGKEGEGKALYKAFTSRSIENFSEMFGEYFGMAGKTLMNTTLGKKISSSALMRSMDAFTTADWTKQFNQILKDGKYNGFIGETAEEYVGGLLNAAFVGDQSFEDLASTDNLVQTVAAVGLMSGIFGSVNLAGIRLARYKARKDLEKSEKEAYNLLGEDFDVLRDNISSLDPDAQQDAVKNVLASPDLDRDQKEAVFDYFYKQSYYNGLKFGENKRIEEAVQAETEAVRAESNPGTGMYIEASKIDPLSGERIPGTIVQGTMEDGKDRVTWKETEGDPEMILKPEIDPATVRAEPIQDVIDASVEAVRESEQAKIDQDSRYSPDIPEPQLESTFTVNGKKYMFTQPTPEGWFLAQEVKEDGSLGAVTDEFDKTAYFDAKQAEIDAAEAIQDQGIQELASNADITFADKPSQITIENAVTSPSEESNMSQNPAGAEESAADVPDQDTSTVIPADENGNLLYHQAPVEATLSDILDGSLDSDEIDAFVGENKKAASALLKKVSEKPPKMSTNKTKYLAQKKAWLDRVAEAEQQVSYWNDVESILKESRMKPGDKAAEEIKSMGEPLTGEELAAVMLANGSIKLTKESYKKETGAGEEETKKMFGLFASAGNGGVSIERAGELVMLADLENGTNHFDQEDPNAGRNAVIEVLSSARTRGDLIDYVKNNREAIAERERQAEYNAYAEWCEEVFHMSPEEYEAYEEDLRKQAEAVTDEAIEYVSGEIADEIQLIREEQSEIGAILAQNKNSDEKIERNDEGGTGGLREGSGQLLPEEQSIQAGGTGRTEEGYSAADLSLNSEDGIAQESASGEIDENGKLFVLSSDGTTTFGVIPKETGLAPAPIKLSEGFQNEKNKGYGLRHIESNHGEQILEAGFPSIENFVETVSKGFTVIKKGNQRGDNHTYLLEVKDKHNNTLFVELSKDGSYWNVNSAGIFNERYSKKKDIVWTLPAVSSSTNADATGVNHGTTKGETVASGNSPQTISSGDKYNDISPQKQADDKKIFVSPERADDENLLDYAERISEAKNQYEKEDRHGKASVGQNRLVTDERYAELKRRMLEKLGGQMNIGVDPEILAIGTEMAVYHIEKGARKFSAYAKAMISDLGDSIRPYLKAFYNGARELPEMEVLSREMDNYEDVRRFDVTNFDKSSTDILAMAETISKEQEVASQVKEAKRKKNPSGKKGKDKSLSLRKTDLFNQNIEEHEEVQRRNGREIKEVRTGSHEGSVGRGGPGNKSENLSVGRQTRKEVDGRDAGREVGGVHGSNGAHQDGSGGIHGLSSLAPSVKKELNQNNYHFDDNHLDIPAGDVSKLKANLSAIRTLHEVEDSGKPATEKQKEILSRYVGWGGLSNALNESKYSLRSHPWNADTNWNAKYLPFYEQLKEALTEEEFKSAIQSTTTSHYTPEPIIRSLWKIAERIGFKGGRVSEPAMGVGHIIGFMPKDISSRSWISGFEIDSLSGRISKVLYPDAHVRVEGYETEFTPRSKDLVITNVPFGKEVPYDKALDRTFRKKMGGAYNLHNYFIAKGLLELKEGGLGVFVTSSATMDGTDSRFREFVAGNGIDLVGAIRLPNNAFLKNAGTSVTADVLVFRRRGAGEASNGINFISTTPIGEGSYEEQGELRKKPLMVNEYFAGHPEMMLGDMMTAHDAGSGGLYSGASQTLKARPDLDLNQALSEAIDKLPKDILGRDSNVSADMMERTELSNGTLTVKDNKVYVSTAGVLEPISVKPTFMYQGKERSTADAIKDYNAIKDTLKRLILAEQSTDADPEPLRKQLNEEYDRFVDNYGTLNRNKALNDVFAEDNEHSLPLSLEKIEKIPSPSGKSILYQVSKGKGILNKRVSFPVVEPSKAANLQDAINISRSYRGTIDVPYIAQLINMSEEEAMEDMLRSGVAYRDPLTGNLVDKSVYLSGNVKEKLEEARAAADSNPEYEKNVADLASVQPDTIRFGDISYRLGTTWIPAEYLNKFAEDVAGIANANIQYISVVDEFVLGRSAYVSDFSKSGMYKTDRIGVIDLFAAALNQRKPKVYDEVRNYNPSTGTSSKTRVVNEIETQAAAEKIMALSDKFVEYIDGFTSAHKELERIYNDRYNNFRLREYELPSFEHYPHSNEEITLREHQTKAVQRCLSESTLLAHQVGTGKTFTMVTTAMEMRRLGIAKKPMIVVQNATLEDFVKDFYKLYPGAHVLAPGKNERGAENRTRLFNLIATGDFDAIVIPQSFMQFIPDDEGRKKELIQKRIETYERVIEATEDESLKRRLQKDVDNLRDEFEGREKVKKSSVKEKAKAASRIKTKVERNLDRRTDEVMTFEQMGIDALFIDEAHNFKKIGFATKMSNVKGIDTGSSQRANSLLLKSTWIREKNNGRNVILATGTPITNTMAEVWTMMNFVAPDILEAYDIKSFDEFATTFGTVEPSLEFTATGNFKIADRFKSYVNVPELVKAFRSHADVVLTKDVTEFEKDKSIPKLRGEQITNIVIDKNEDLQDVMQVLIKELEAYSNMSGPEKKRMSALPLVVFTKAKQAAIDLRLINPTYPDNPNSKTNQVVSNVIKLYKESEAEKGAQLVFCDSYQSPGEAPKMDLFGFDPDVPRFNLYEDIKQKLIEGGIPEKEIAIVNNYDGERRKGLFEKVRNGDVRVLLGSTEKMGVGVNVQDRLYGLHHIDAPLRPMDFEQRNGRILRQGNNYALWGKPVNIVTYGVQGTLDATAYDRLQIKQNFINQMMKGDVDGRIMEDQDDEDPSGMTFNQMAATLSGDKTAQLLFVAENKLKKLRNLKRGDANSKSGMAETVEYARGRILVLESKKKTYERIHEIIAEHFPRGVVSIKVEGKNIREKFASSLDPIIDSYEEAYSLNRGIPPLKMMLNAGRAEVVIHFDEGRMVYELYAGKEHVVEGRQFNGGRGLMSSIEHQLKAVENNLISVDNEIASNQRKIEGLTKAINTSWGREDELKKAEQEVADLKKQLEEKAKANDEKKSRAEVESTVPEGDVRYRSSERGEGSKLDNVNERFNEELRQQIEGILPKDHIYQLGTPSEFLLSAGIPNLPIELPASQLAYKATSGKHDYNLSEVMNLPKAIANPIASFSYGDKGKSQNILTMLEHEGENFLVGMFIRPTIKGRILEVNSIRNVFPKNSESIVKWIEQGKLTNANKKKLLNFLDQQHTNHADVAFVLPDEQVKQVNSETSVTKIVENFKNPTLKQGEIVSEINDLSSKLHTPVTVVSDVNEIADTNEKTQLRKRSSKGWYDPQTKEIVIVLPNNRDVADVQRTFLHEAVAHHGLRKLFGDDFDTFLNNVYANTNEGIRREILRRTQGNPLKLHEATEEYLADLAERGFDNKEERSLWSRIKDAFIEMLRKVGVDLGFKLSDADLRYILWRSYRNLEEGNLLDLAEDVSMRNKWGIGDYGIRYKREATDMEDDGTIEEYEKRLRRTSFMAREAYQDSTLALRELQDILAKHSGKKIETWENADIAENQRSSKNTVEKESYRDNYFTPLLQQIANLIKRGETYQEIVNYMIAKHGLERNDVFARRDADAWLKSKMGELDKKKEKEKINESDYEKLAAELKEKSDRIYDKNKEKDYSGLKGLMKDVTGEIGDYNEFANTLVHDFESRNDSGTLWEKANEATNRILKKSFESGLMSKGTYDHIKGMFKYYIPLRGWDETTAADVYSYINSERSSVNSVPHKARGRVSLADDPIATIANMAESAIMQGNKNLVKQNFLNMIVNHPASVATVKEMWYVFDVENNCWKPSFPEIPSTAAPDEIALIIEEHDKRMKNLEKQNLARRNIKELDVKYQILPNEASEHIVSVKRSGKEYVIFINGNPRAAQAVNGLTNPDAEGNIILSGISKLNRQLAANFTTRNPGFVGANLSRDLIFAMSAVSVKENSAYSSRFKSNVGKSMATVYRGVVKGKLDMSNEADRYFKEFLENGGETGYTALTNVDQYKKKIQKDLEGLSGNYTYTVGVKRMKNEEGEKVWAKKTVNSKTDYFKVIRYMADRFSDLNRWAEDISRFTTYMTSRQEGRGIVESVNDAKEVTVNFNRKGAGYKTMIKNKPWYSAANVLGASAGIFRNLFLFFNAGVQSLGNFGKLAIRNKKGFGKLVGGFTVAGFLIPFLNQWLSSLLGDDKDYYNDLSDWTRRNNMCIYAGGGRFVTIPLPIELRAFWGLGDLCYQNTVGKTGMTGEEIAYDAINQITELLPLNPLGNNGDYISTLMPDVMKPFWQLNQNEDFTGKPIYKENDFNQDFPEWSKAYKGTASWLVNLSEWTNELGGGDKYRTSDVSLLNWNPAKVEHLFEAYFGGLGKTFNQLGKTLWYGAESVLTGKKSDNLVARNVPVLNRFLKTVDEKSSFSKINKQYYRYVKEYEGVDRVLKGYAKEVSSGNLEYLDKLISLQKSDAYEKLQIFQQYKSHIEYLENQRNKIPEKNKDEYDKIQNQIIKAKSEMVEWLGR